MKQALLDINVDQLMPDPAQPRKSFGKEELERLAASVKARGILQPLRVKRDDDRHCWQIIVGECRWRAAVLAGLKTVPCLEVEGDLSETDVLSDQIVENAIRNSLRPLELARSLAKLKALKACNSQTLAKELGLSGAGITRAEALLSLPVDVQSMVDDGRVPESAAYEISRLPDEEAQRSLALLVAARKLNRDQVQEAVRGAIGKRNVAPRGGRLSCKLDGGISVIVARSGLPLVRADLIAAIERLRKELKKLDEGGDMSELARAS